MSEVVLLLASETTDSPAPISTLSHPIVDNSSILLLHEYGGGIIVLASFTTLHMKLELSESKVLACDNVRKYRITKPDVPLPIPSSNPITNGYKSGFAVTLIYRAY